ncbi:MAG: PilZ domain-containing protein [Erythrobacter sp.]
MERRQESRKTTQDTVRVNLGGRSLRCRMLNLSASGCMIECDDAITEVGAHFEVLLGPGVMAQGRVAWQLGESVGVLFHAPIPETIVREYAIEGWPLDSMRGNLDEGPKKNG